MTAALRMGELSNRKGRYSEVIKCDKENVSLKGTYEIILAEFVMIAETIYMALAEVLGADEAKEKLKFYFSLAFKSSEEVHEMTKALEQKILNVVTESKEQQEKERED